MFYTEEQIKRANEQTSEAFPSISVRQGITANRFASKLISQALAAFMLKIRLFPISFMFIHSRQAALDL